MMSAEAIAEAIVSPQTCSFFDSILGGAVPMSLALDSCLRKMKRQLSVSPSRPLLMHGWMVT